MTDQTDAERAAEALRTETIEQALEHTQTPEDEAALKAELARRQK
jgi:hypothetical protein